MTSLYISSFVDIDIYLPVLRNLLKKLSIYVYQGVFIINGSFLRIMIFQFSIGLKIAVVHPTIIEGNNGSEKVAYEFAKHLNADLYTTQFNANLKEHFKDINKMIKYSNNRSHGSISMEYYEIIYKMLFKINIKADFIIYSSHLSTYHIPFNGNIPYLYYCHTPDRSLYDLRQYILQQIDGWDYGKKKMMGLLLTLRKIQDQYQFKTIVSPNNVVVNSKLVYDRYRKFYNKKPRCVIYPPIDLSKYYNEESEGFYFTASGLKPNKRIDWQIKAFSNSKEKLLIAGDGRDRERLEKIAKQNNSNVEFLGRVSEKDLLHYYATCKAFIFSAKEEDFGIVPLEAIASGKPVICVNEGGPLEYLNISNSILFKNENQLKRFIKTDVISEKKFNTTTLIKSIQDFDITQTMHNIRKEIDQTMLNW